MSDENTAVASSTGAGDTTSHSDSSSLPAGLSTNPDDKNILSGNPEAAGARADNPQDAEAKDARLSHRFAQLAKRDKALREERKKLEAERQQLARWRDAERLVKDDPLKLLEDLGLSYEQLTEKQFERLTAAEAAKDPLRRIEAVEETIKQAQEQARLRQERAQQAVIDAAIERFQAQIKERVSQQAERFELIEARAAHEDVFRLIEAHFSETKEILPIDQAAQLVEDQLLEEAQALLKAKKLRQLASPSEQRDSSQASSVESERSKAQERSSEERPESSTEGSARGASTLTNGVNGASAGIPRGSVLDLEESKRKAAALLKWT